MKKVILGMFIALFSTLSLAKTPLTIVVGYPPGGDTDVLARLVAVKLAPLLDKPVIVENRVGAAGSIASNYVSSATGDGSIIMFAPSTFSTAPIVNQNIKYNPITDFTPIMQLSGHGMFAVVNTSTGINNIKELISANKDGRVQHFGSPGVGTPMHVLGEMFNRAASTNITHIPFKGNADIINNMLGNQIGFTWITLLPVIPHIDAGKMTVIGVASNKRSSFYPNVPTLAEQGIKDVEIESWLGFLGPKEMSKETANEINRRLNEVIAMPDVKDKLKSLAMIPVGSTPELFKETLRKDNAKYTRVIKMAGIKID